MKITNGQHYYLNAVNQNKQATVPSNSKAVESINKKEHISVDISEEARNLSKASLQAAPSEKAAAIKAAIQAGTYAVSAEKIASGIIESMTAPKKVEE